MTDVVLLQAANLMTFKLLQHFLLWGHRLGESSLDSYKLLPPLPCIRNKCPRHMFQNCSKSHDEQRGQTYPCHPHPTTYVLILNNLQLTFLLNENYLLPSNQKFDKAEKHRGILG